MAMEWPHWCGEVRRTKGESKTDSVILVFEPDAIKSFLVFDDHLKRNKISGSFFLQREDK